MWWTHWHLDLYLFYQPVPVKIYQEAISLGVAFLLTLGVISILSVCVSLSLTGSAITWRSKITDAWGDIYSISLRQSKTNRKHFLIRLNNAHGLSYFPSDLLAAAGGWKHSSACASPNLSGSNFTSGCTLLLDPMLSYCFLGTWSNPLCFSLHQNLRF